MSNYTLETGDYNIIPRKILQSTTITQAQKLLLIAIWSFTYSREGHKAILSDKILTEVALISKPTLYKELDALKGKGLIVINKVRTEYSKQLQREIQLQIEAVASAFGFKLISKAPTKEIKETRNITPRVETTRKRPQLPPTDCNKVN